MGNFLKGIDIKGIGINSHIKTYNIEGIKSKSEIKNMKLKK